MIIGMDRYVLIEVGCLECEEWSSVIWSEADESTARERFAVEVQERGYRRPDDEDLEGAPSSLVLAAGTGGSYHYAFQLHRVMIDA